MKSTQYQDEKILVDQEDKEIRRINYKGQSIIKKTFFQHSNKDVYQLLKENPHENIGYIYDVIDEEMGFSVLEMDLGSMTLSDVIPIKNHSLFISIASQICDALSHLHSLNIVHRDLKPDNIYYHEGKVILTDFDISKPIVDAPRKDTQLFGSIGYASPEQFGFLRSDSRSDIYSLGVVLNVMSCGKLLTEALTDAPVRKIISKCTEMNRQDRYQRAEDVKHDLINTKLISKNLTLPGFRTRNRKKMIIASIGYFLIFGMIIVIETEGSTSVWQDISSKILLAILILPALIVITNYLNVRSLMPRPLLRYPLVGSILLWASIMVVLIFGYGLIFGIIDSVL